MRLGYRDWNEGGHRQPLQRGFLQESPVSVSKRRDSLRHPSLRAVRLRLETWELVLVPGRWGEAPAEPKDPKTAQPQLGGRFVPPGTPDPRIDSNVQRTVRLPLGSKARPI